jgi:hypothetical protein
MTNEMAVVIAKYSKSKARTIAAIKYIQHRTGRDGEKITRDLFGFDGEMSRDEAYRMLDEAGKRTTFFRIVISPDQQTEDTYKDLHLQSITEQTILALEEAVGSRIPFVAAVHDDHAPHRHVHLVACVTSRLGVDHFKAMRDAATDAALAQRQEKDLAREQQAEQQQQEGVQWAA